MEPSYIEKLLPLKKNFLAHNINKTREESEILSKIKLKPITLNYTESKSQIS